jgi:hypothetical protein
MIFALSSCSTNEELVDVSQVDELEEALDYEKTQVSTLSESVETLEASVQALEAELEEKESTIIELEENIDVLSSSQNPNQLVSEAFSVMELIANQDAAGLNAKVSPTEGVRFSPYQYVDENDHIVFHQNNEIPSMFTDTTNYLWGEYDGTGDDISYTFSDYYNEFVYDEDYLNPEILGINTVVSSGNTINNIEDIYPNAEYVEFYFDGFDPQFGGMDWRSLTLVFEEVSGTYYLIGIVHGSWTI